MTVSHVTHTDTSANRTRGRNDEKMYSVPSPREACFDQGDVKEEKDIVTFNEENHEDILLEEGPQIERVTVFHTDTCQCDIYRRNNRDKRFPREACFDQGDVKVERDSVAFNEETDEDTPVEERHCCFQA